MYPAVKAIAWNSLFFLFFFFVFFARIHFDLFDTSGIEITIAFCIFMGLLIGGLITLKQYRAYGISSLRLLSGKTIRFIGLNCVQSLVLPLNQKDSYDLVTRLASAVFQENLWTPRKLPSGLYAAQERNHYYLSVFYFNSISPSETQVEISTRPNSAHMMIYDYLLSRRIVYFWIEALAKRSQNSQIENKVLQECYPRIETGLLEFIPNILLWFLFVSIPYQGQVPFNLDKLIPHTVPFQIRVEINKPFGKLTEDDYSRIKEFHLSGKRLISLTGIQHCNNLNKLALDDCKIKDLSPLQGCTNLEDLSLNSNRIVDISPLSDLTRLTTLNLSENKISDTKPIENLTGLEHLDISHNKITDFSPLNYLQNLKVIGLSGYGFENFNPVTNLKNLVELMYSDNAVSDLTPLSELKKLKYLEMKSNRVSDITPLRNMNNLESLILKDNLVSDISLIPEMKNLKLVDLSRNKISDLTPLVEAKDLNPELRITFKGNILTWHSIFSDLQTLKDRGIDVQF